MKNVHLVIPDLFLPKDFAAEVCAELRLPALEKLLGRGRSEILEPVPLENLLCEMFGMSCQADAPIAPVSAAFDGLGAGCWLRADPVHLRLQRDQMLLLPNMEISADEAGQMCARLDIHFAGHGIFCAASATLVCAAGHVAGHPHQAAVASHWWRCARCFANRRRSGALA